MTRFTRLYLDLDATTATGEKVAILEAYFAEAPPEDAAWTLALLTGNRPKRAASTNALRTLALERAGIPPWLFDECHAAVGDLSETIALLIPDAPSSPVARGKGPREAGSEGAPPDAAPEPLHHTIERRVLPLIGASEDEKARIIRDAWAVMDADERFVYHKLVRGGFRVGVQKRLVSRALAGVAGVDQKTMAQRLTGAIEPTPDAYRRVLAGETAGERKLAPLPFFLANPIDGEHETFEAKLGDARDWLAEWKYDGVRAQLVRRGGETAVWSRGEELTTDQFPELVTAARGLPADAVLDGEVLIWDAAEDRPRPFAELQTRLNRKAAPAAQPGLFDTTRLVMLAYDLLERDGVDLRETIQRDRRAALETFLSDLDDDTIRLSPLIEAESWDGLAERRDESRARGVEGLMLKHREGVYGVGRARSDTGWWKWKVDPFSVDAVMVAAQPGSGRRASLYTDYTFALRADDAPAAGLVTFAKAYSGLTQEEIEELDRWIRAHTTSKSGPFRAVEPVQVFEIAFEGVRRSSRHKSGVAVRFPRIARWRTDKPAAEADTIDAVTRLIDGGGA